MRISPINFRTNNVSAKRSYTAKQADDIHTTSRQNSLSDMEFNIIADTIRSQNLKNQMDVRLMNLKRQISSQAAADSYHQQI
ncbi:hypothetical protein II906_01665 [bacterium]|nr:hypothetical protein [bacterium]